MFESEVISPAQPAEQAARLFLLNGLGTGELAGGTHGSRRSTPQEELALALFTPGERKRSGRRLDVDRFDLGGA